MNAKIVIASTLKPVWDPRAYEKIGKSLAGTGSYSIEIIGSGTEIPDDKTIKFHNHNTDRSILNRLFLQCRIFAKLLRIRPDLLIIGTHELIIPGVIYKILTGKKLIYDIRENYNYNLRFQKIYPSPIRQFLASYIRTKELFFQHSFNYFFSAEECYLDEIKFLKKNSNKVLVLENKTAAKIQLREDSEDSKIQLLISGTISENYGVLDALAFFKKLPPEQYNLTIIGHCPDPGFKALILAEAGECKSVSLWLSQEPIPHTTITEKFSSKTIGLLPYKSNKSTENKLPTKLFEYVANGIPVLIANNPKWCKFVSENNCGICIDFTSPPDNNIIRRCYNLKSSILQSDLQSLMWKSSEPALFKAIVEVLRN